MAKVVDIDLVAQDLLSKNLLKSIGTFMAKQMKRTIKKRTARGKFLPGSEGPMSRLTRYNAEYAEREGKSPAGPVNLEQTGAMMDSFYVQHRRTKRQTMKFFPAFRPAVNRQKFEYIQEKGTPFRGGIFTRKFVGLTDRELNRIVSRAKAQFFSGG